LDLVTGSLLKGLDFTHYQTNTTTKPDDKTGKEAFLNGLEFITRATRTIRQGSSLFPLHPPIAWIWALGYLAHIKQKQEHSLSLCHYDSLEMLWNWKNSGNIITVFLVQTVPNNKIIEIAIKIMPVLGGDQPFPNPDQKQG
jgi:hypothetical protein